MTQKWTQRPEERRALKKQEGVHDKHLPDGQTSAYDEAIVEFMKDHDELYDKTNG